MRIPSRLPAVIVAVWLLVVTAVFTSVPPVWPDEGLFADPAYALITHGRLATPLLAGILPGAADHTYWMPPAYFVVLGAVFVMTRAGIVAIRGLSALLGVVALALIWRRARRQSSRRTGSAAACIAVGLAAASPLFLAAGVIGRMEMLTLVFMLAALDRLDERLTTRRLLGVGGFAALAALSHPIGLSVTGAIILAIAQGGGDAGARIRRIAAMIAPVVMACAGFLAYGLRDWPSFRAQLGLQIARKAAGSFWDRVHMFPAFLSPRPYAQVATLMFFAAGYTGLWMAARRDTAARAWAIAGTLLLGAAVWSTEQWYAVYAVPFAALGVAWLAREWQPSTAHAGPLRRGGTIAGLCACAVALGTGAVEEAHSIASARHYHYLAWTRALDANVLAALQPGTVVLLDSIPDPYPELLALQGRLHMRHVPPVPIDAATLRAAFATVDVIVEGERTIHARPVREELDPSVWLLVSETSGGGYDAKIWQRRR